MRKQQIIGALLILLFVFTAKGQGETVEVLHYNLLRKYAKNSRQCRQEKEKELSKIFAESNATVFSILEDGHRNCFVRKEVFQGHANYGLQESTISTLQHSLYFDKEKASVLQSQSYTSEKAVFFYYQLQLKGAVEPLHLFVYKQSSIEHPVEQHEEILNFIADKKIEGQLLLLGGSASPNQMLGDGYISPPKTEVELINLMSLFYLYDDSYKFIWHDDVDFLYVSKDIWIPGEGAITYERKSHSLGQDLEFENNSKLKHQNRPFAFTLRLSKEEKNVYKSPEVDLISQDVEFLLFSISWDEDLPLNIEIVSMIGNRFYSKDVKYDGTNEEYVVDINSFPTGIYLLKVVDSQGRMVFRKFTKY